MGVTSDPGIQKTDANYFLQTTKRRYKTWDMEHNRKKPDLPLDPTLV